MRRKSRMSSPARLGAAALVMATCATLSELARAQPVETSAARADRLFREGKSALEASRFAEACPKLAESQHLDPGMGTLLALALCHEASGQTASAWREFKDVAQGSQAARADRAALASQHIKTLEPQLSTIAVNVPADLRPTAQVRIDGTVVPPADLGAPIPEDPGDHVVEAVAAGSPPWQLTVHLGSNHDVKAVTVPSASPAAVPPPPVPVQPVGMEPRHRLGFIVGGAGGALVVTGGIFGGLSLSEHSSATKLCPSSPCSSSTGVSDNNTARTYAWVSDFTVGFGLAGLGVATYLLLTHDEAHAPTTAISSTRIVPSAGPGTMGLSLSGAW